MVVYADILIILNVAVDYFLLLATSGIIQRKPPVLRLILSALIGGFSSLYIFMPKTSVITDIAFRIAVCLLMTLSAFGFRGTKSFFRAAGALLLTTVCYGGAMTAVWYLFKPGGMAVINSVVYFGISPIVLIISSAAAYAVYIIFSAIFSKNARFAEKCDIIVSAGDKSVTACGIVDTGNSLKDVFGSSDVIIADEKCVAELFGNEYRNDPTLKTRYRLMPCGTVGGETALDGYRCDRATVCDGKKTVVLEKPILAISKTKINDGCRAIVNPKIFM